MKVCIVQPKRHSLSETFLKSQAERMPAHVSVLELEDLRLNGRSLYSNGHVHRALYKAKRLFTGRTFEWQRRDRLIRAFGRCKADVVLAQYGPTGVHVVDACRDAGIPLVVHFHGYDASMHAVLERHKEDYERMFQTANAIVTGCGAMRNRLIGLGSIPEKTYVSYESGVDVGQWRRAQPGIADPVFVSVGRFVEKKAPHLTILAFSGVRKQYPGAKLRMIGGGKLFDACESLITALKLDDSVTLLGPQGFNVVREELAKARCFVQHSVTAPDGDAEGTAITPLEAAAAGLPVVATRHAGIAETVIDGTTGYLVDEHDWEGMGERMCRILADDKLAHELGEAGRNRVATYLSQDRCIGRLWSIVEAAAHNDRGVPNCVEFSTSPHEWSTETANLQVAE